MTRARSYHQDRFCCAYCGKAKHRRPRGTRKPGRCHSWENFALRAARRVIHKGDRLLTEAYGLGAREHCARDRTGDCCRAVKADPSWARCLGEGAA